MYCDEKRSVLHFYQQIIFLLGAIGAYLVVMLTDKIGRLSGFYIMGVLLIIAPIMAFISNSIFIICLAIGLI